MSFMEAIKAGFANYVNFSSRAVRSEYWFWVLFTTLVSLVTAIVDAVAGMTLTNPIWILATILPGIAVTVRRLHDLDRSGWWLLLVFIPLIGAIVLIVWFCARGTEGANRFGPDPFSIGRLSPRPAV